MITWGDGATTPGAVTPDGTGGFLVSGSHFYTFPGNVTVHTAVLDAGGGKAAADSPIAVGPTPVSGSGVPVVGLELTPLNVPVAVFTQGNGAKPASAFSAVIDWGDGAVTPGTVVAAGGGYTVFGTHIYTDEGFYPMTVRVSNFGATTLIATSAHVTEEQLPPGFGGTPNQMFISEVYRELFGRPVDPSGLAHWSAQLDAGVGRLQVILNIQSSTTREFFGREVDDLYVRYLHRPADPGGLLGGVVFLEGGGTGRQLALTLMASPEYYARAGGTPDGFLRALYADALGRDIDPGTLAAGEAAFAAGAGARVAVANVVLSSPEYRRDVAADFFAGYIGRPPRADELAAVENALVGGMSEELLAVLLLSQDEVFQKANV
jgi:hypothetical protein